MNISDYVSVEEVQRMPLQDGADRGRQQVEGGQDGLAQRDVRSRPPRPARLRHQDPSERDEERGHDTHGGSAQGPVGRVR